MEVKYNKNTGLYKAVWRGVRVGFSSDRMTAIKNALNCFNL